MSVLNCCAVCLVFVVFLVIIRQLRGELALPLSLCISVGVIGLAAAVIIPVLEYLNSLSGTVGEGYMTLLFKALGISLITSTSAELCRDSGENAIASKIELLGKCELIALSLPLFKSLLELVGEVIKG